MLRIALTGGIASGKTAASERFQTHGIPTIDTDVISRELVEPGQAGLQQIVKQFGELILNADGTLNRAALRDRIFADPEEREQLNQILHPMIHQRLLELANQAQGPYQIWVIPLLAESRSLYPYDRVLLIDSPEALQLQRLSARDQTTPSQATRALAAQASRTERQAIADDIIVNDRSLAELLKKIDQQHLSYLKLSEH